MSCLCIRGSWLTLEFLKSASPSLLLTTLLDPQVGFEVGHDESTTTQVLFEDEIAFAAEYRVVALVSDFKVSLKKLVSRRQFLEGKGLYDQPGQAGLAFSEDDEEDDENVERFI